jgi:hypothetical protein
MITANPDIHESLAFDFDAAKFPRDRLEELGLQDI